MSALAPAPGRGVAPLRGRLQWQTGRQESTSLYYTYNIKYLHFPGFFLLFLLVFCIQSTPETGNRMIIHYLFSFFFVLFLLHAL